MTNSQIVKLYGIGVFLLLLGVGLVVGSLYASIHERRIARKGFECTAILMASKQEKDDRGRNAYSVDLEYPLPVEGLHRQWFKVPQPVYAEATSQGSLLIRFDRSKPGNVVFVDFLPNVNERSFLGTVLGLIGFVILIVAIRASVLKFGRNVVDKRCR